MINFPDNPSNNQVFTSGNQTWVYDGTKWLAMGVAGGIYLPLSGGRLTGPLNPAGGIVGVVDGSDAALGQLGEVISALVNAPGITLTTGTPSNIAVLPLTAGDWDVQGELWTQPSVVGATQAFAGIGPISGVMPTQGINTSRFTFNATMSGAIAISLRTCRVSLAAPANYYLIAQVNFASGTCTAFGNIWARRAR